MCTVAKKKDTKLKAKSKPKPQAPPPAAPSISAYRKVHTEDQEQDMMASIFSSMDQFATRTAPSTRKRKPEPERYHASPAHSNGKARSRTGGYERGDYYTDGDTSSDGPVEAFPSEPSSDADLDGNLFSPKKKPKIANDSGVIPAIDRMKHFHVGNNSAGEGNNVNSAAEDSFDDIDMDAYMAVDDDDFDDEPQKPSAPVKKEELPEVKFKPPMMSKPDEKKSLDATPAWLSVYDSLSVTKDDTLGSLASSSKSAGGSKATVLEDDGSFRFFWQDYLEHEGRLYFTGKTQDKKTNAWISCCVTVENLERNLFVLPRERRVEEDETGELYETDVKPDMDDVYDDFDRVRKKAGIKSWRAKYVKRRYAFGERDVPRDETDWLKVVYGFDGKEIIPQPDFCSYQYTEPQISANVSSPNFARIFGTNTSAFELLVLKRKIMGPCWLQIKKPVLDHKGVSYVVAIFSLNTHSRTESGFVV